MTMLNKLTIAQARDGLRQGDFSAQELTDACLDAVRRAKILNAFIHICPEMAQKQAKDAQARIQQGQAPDLCGITLGIKDLFCTKNLPSQAASRILEGFISPYESTVTSKLFGEGAIMIGKLNMDEFAMGSSNETSVYAPAISPWQRKGKPDRLTPGGSSGGSAAAVAAALCLGATGTDTGGSIRQPAAFTGIVGLKPTYGRCSRWGIIAFASSLDQAGPMTKTVRDSAIMLRAMSGYDPKDSTSANRKVPNFETALTGDIRGKTIGIPREYRLEGISHEIEELWQSGCDILKAAGAKIVDISLPHTKYALPAYYIIAPAEASSNLARYDGVRFGRRAHLTKDDGIIEMYEKTRAEGFGKEVKRRIMLGTYVLSAGFYDAYYNRACKVRTLIRQDFEQVFDAGIDAILTPTTPNAAFGLGEIRNKKNPIEMYLNDIFTVTVNLAGLPAISVPAGSNNEGLPLGLQLIGKPWEEGNILNIASLIEIATPPLSPAKKSPAKNWWEN